MRLKLFGRIANLGTVIRNGALLAGRNNETRNRIVAALLGSQGVQ